MTDPHGLARGLTNYGDADFSLYLRRSFATSMGYSREMLARPVVGIAQSASGFNNCHRHFPELIDAVKRGVVAAGGLPLDFPTISLGEVFLSPTSGQPLATRSAITAQATPCDVLHLQFGGITTNLLGLDVALSPVTLDITGQAGPLGELVCQAVATLGNVAALVGLLNQILGLLTGLLGGVA